MFSPIAIKAGVLTALSLVHSFAQKLFRMQKADSLVRFTRSTRVEPIALVDRRLAHQPYMPDVMQSLSSIFTGYYLQAVALSVNVGKINVIKLLDALNPTRDVADAGAAGIVSAINAPSGQPSMLSLEAYTFGTPSLEDDDQSASEKKSGSGVSFGKDSLTTVKEAVNLSVGKLIEITIDSEGKKATFPISIRLITTIVDGNILAHILGDGSRNVTAKERFHSWKAGQLEFWRDVVLCQDLIDEHRSALLKDKSGAYAEILRRRHENQKASVMSQTPSVGTASNLVVISKQTAKELESAISGRLSDPRIRDKIFASTYIMIMVVVDPEWEQVTIYHRGIAIPTEMSIKELKASNKGTGPDVAEILKAYQLGNNPVF